MNAKQRRWERRACVRLMKPWTEVLVASRRPHGPEPATVLAVEATYLTLRPEVQVQYHGLINVKCWVPFARITHYWKPST